VIYDRSDVPGRRSAITETACSSRFGSLGSWLHGRA